MTTSRVLVTLGRARQSGAVATSLSLVSFPMASCLMPPAVVAGRASSHQARGAAR